MPSRAERCRIVLVRTQIAANMGATARVMRNFGLADLRLVAPECDPTSSDARKLSTQGEHILLNAPQVTDLAEAVADCVLVVATSARTGGLFRTAQVRSPRTLMPLVTEAMTTGPVALVFGPEQTGLSNAEVTRCHYLVNIPTDDAYPVLNLAQAVAVCLYELQVSLLTALPHPHGQASAPFDQQERMFANLEQSLREIHFLYGTQADALMHAVRHLIGRARPTEVEVNLLMGLARQIRWSARQTQGGQERLPPQGSS